MTKTFTPALLVAELDNDPAGMGYSALVHATQGPQIADLRELIDSKTSLGAGPVAALPMSASDFLDRVNSDELDGLTSLQLQQLQLRLSVGNLKVGDQKIQAWLGKVFGSSPTSLTAVRDAATTTGSRGEVLWGTNFMVSDDQVSAACTTILGS